MTGEDPHVRRSTRRHGPQEQDSERTPIMPAEFLPIAHPALVGKPPEGPGWTHEIKFDSWRLQLNGPPAQARLKDAARRCAAGRDGLFLTRAGSGGRAGRDGRAGRAVRLDQWGCADPAISRLSRPLSPCVDSQTSASTVAATEA